MDLCTRYPALPAVHLYDDKQNLNYLLEQNEKKNYALTLAASRCV